MQGLILLNKPGDRTSFSAVAAIKRIAGEKRVGHTGTLDPMATGVLPILLGRATALSDFLLDADKKYIAKIKLGITTDTEDITGNIISSRDVEVSQNDLDYVLKSFRGVTNQRPPMYSAIRKDGVRLYTLAREGKTVDIPERKVEIYSIETLEPLDSDNSFTVNVHVSKGTYIRSFARDIGESLGCGAVLTSLCRTYAGGFSLDQCVQLENLTSDSFVGYLKDEEVAVMHLREVFVTWKQAVRFCNGGQLDFERLHIGDYKDGELFRVKFHNQFLGIGFADAQNNRVGIKCIINYPEETDK